MLPIQNTPAAKISSGKATFSSTVRESCCLLEQETYLLSDIVQLFLIESRDFLADNRDGARVGRLQADEQLQQDALSASAPPENGDGFATRDLKSDSIQDLLAVKRLVKILDRNRLVSRFAAHLASPHSVRINRFSASSSDLFHAFRECERGEAIRPNEKVRVLIDLAGGTRNVIKKDSLATIRSEGLVGDKFVEISFGSEQSPKVGDGDMIQGEPPLAYQHHVGQHDKQ